VIYASGVQAAEILTNQWHLYHVNTETTKHLVCSQANENTIYSSARLNILSHEYVNCHKYKERGHILHNNVGHGNSVVGHVWGSSPPSAISNMLFHNNTPTISKCCWSLNSGLDTMSMPWKVLLFFSFLILIVL